MSEKDKNWHYSGDWSKPFWDRVNAIPYKQGGREIYLLGCQLQNMEERVLRKLAKLENAKGGH